MLFLYLNVKVQCTILHYATYCSTNACCFLMLPQSEELYNNILYF